jgi:hypothetical protein
MLISSTSMRPSQRSVWIERRSAASLLAVGGILSRNSALLLVLLLLIVIEEEIVDYGYDHEPEMLGPH